MHDHVFSILKLISQDGAFDQIRPVKALIKNNKDLKTFCYDLSAATDRFPISVQVDVLSHLYNRTVAESWKQLLVNRDYYLNETKQSYRYGAGQPMGALSS
jgi:trehalose/maltose hydrolase-like predicted phosphorylase